MKKWFLMAPAMLFAIFSCSNDPKDNGTKDSVSIFPNEDQIIESTGDNVSVQVTSSGDWTLAPDANHDWVSADKLQGKDGETVLFTVLANDDAENNQEAIYTFKVGKAEAKLKIILKKKEPSVTKLNLLSEADVELTNIKQEFPIKLDTEVSYRELEQVISPASAIYHKDDNPDGWISFKVTLKEDNVVSMMFDVLANPGFEDRTAEITITGGVDGKAVVNVTQMKTPTLKVEKSAYFVDLDGGNVEIKVTANMEYTVEIDENSKSWLSLLSSTDDVHTFKAEPITEGMRTATVTFTSKGGIPPETATITQKGAALIDMAADFSNQNRAWPVWYNPAPVTDMEEITMEALIYVDTWRATGSMNSIMGIENRLLMRTGDAGKANNMVEICALAQYGTSNTSPKEFKITLNTAADLLAAKTWHHIAVTYSVANQEAQVYVNGELKGSMKPTAGYYFRAVNIGVEHSNEPSSGNYQVFDHKRVFWVGYAYEASRWFPGMISEVRIWNKVLAESDIKAANHFYKVEADSPGLVAYWKMDDGTNGTEVDNEWVTGSKCYKDVFKDYTSYGNHLYTDKVPTWKVVSVP